MLAPLPSWDWAVFCCCCFGFLAVKGWGCHVACTGDASDPVCLSHFLDAISQGERIHHQMFTFPLFSKGELSPLDWPWMNKRATEGGLTGGVGSGGCELGGGLFGWVAVGKQSGVWGRASSPLLSVANSQRKGVVGEKISSHHQRISTGPALRL